jgi:hypothetical protein
MFKPELQCKGWVEGPLDWGITSDWQLGTKMEPGDEEPRLNALGRFSPIRYSRVRVNSG